MAGKYRNIIGIVICISVGLFFMHCSNNTSSETLEKQEGIVYLNHVDSARYLGKEVCKNCHFDKYNTFVHTGMGKSFSEAHPDKSSAKFHKDSLLFDANLNLYYQPYWKNKELFLKEFRLSSKGDTLHERIEKIAYIVGSGQHTNSHMVNSNGYVTQAPFTYYTQDGHLDFPPGFENGKNSRFSRKIGLECMSCHNALPEFVLGSTNKFEKVHNGIDCERCHGPGSLHVDKIMRGELTDTSKYIDPTIVNPKKMDAELQFDLCSRCHLQGNTVLNGGKDFFDFKPGMPLSEVMHTFLPKYSNSDDEFIMASHVDRLKMSACFLGAENQLTCISCHNPHVSVEVTPKEHFKTICKSCHQEKQCSEPIENRADNMCTDCHMPKSGSTDIPHVRITDHKIAVHREQSKSDKQGLREFIDLYCVNSKNPGTKIMIQAYLQQFERFEQEEKLLEKAKELLIQQSRPIEYIHEWVHYYYLTQKHGEMLAFLLENNEQKIYSEVLVNKSFDNKDAWTAYRLAIALKKMNRTQLSIKYYKKAVQLAPYVLDFQMEFAEDLIRWGQVDLSLDILENILHENPKMEKAYSLKGYGLALKGDFVEAEKLYKYAIGLNPNDLQAKTNLAGLFYMKGRQAETRKLLKEVLERNPDYELAKRMYQELEKSN